MTSEETEYMLRQEIERLEMRNAYLTAVLKSNVERALFEPIREAIAKANNDPR